MATIAGASQYLNSATLANTQNRATGSASLLDGAGGLLEIGRRINRSGLGLSSRSRQLNENFLNRSSDINALLSLGAGASLSLTGLQTQIKGLQATLPAGSIYTPRAVVKTPSNAEAGGTVDTTA